MNTPSIVRTATADGLYLHGFFQPGSKKTALLHIHGLEGNFYENLFLDVIALECASLGIAWLPVNTRGNGKETDFNTTTDDLRTVGARYELLEEAYFDIDAWMKFLLDQGYGDIILMGHSLGTMKIVRYLSEGTYKQSVKKIILLSPFDKKGLLATEIHTPLPMLLARAQEMVEQGKGKELITNEFDSITVSYETYVSWYKQDALGRCFEFCTNEYDLEALKNIQIPVKVIVGSKDEFFHPSNPDHPEEAMDKMLAVLPHGSGAIIPDAVHSYGGHEEQLAQEITAFL